MTANAAGFQDTANGVITFSDVPTHDPFYEYVHRLVIHISTSPFPPDHENAPTCNTALPCFHPYTAAPRSDAAQHIRQAYRYRIEVDSALAGRAFALRHADAAPMFDAIQAWRSTPTNGMLDGLWITGPVGLAGGYDGNDHFIESGPDRRRVTSISYETFPYGSSFNNWTFPPPGVRDRSFPLSLGFEYHYQSYYAIPNNGHEWWGEYHNGSKWVRVVTLPDTGMTSMPYIAAAAETTYTSLDSGVLQVSDAKARVVGGSLQGWCYETNLVQRKMYASDFGPCNAYSWTVEYRRNPPPPADN